MKSLITHYGQCVLCVTKSARLDFKFEVFKDAVSRKSDFFYFGPEMVHYIDDSVGWQLRSGFTGLSGSSYHDRNIMHRLPAMVGRRHVLDWTL